MIEPPSFTLTNSAPMIEAMIDAPPSTSGYSTALLPASAAIRPPSSIVDHCHRVGLEQVCGHAGAVADVVADVGGDHSRVARVVLGDAGVDLVTQDRVDGGAHGGNG